MGCSYKHARPPKTEESLEGRGVLPRNICSLNGARERNVEVILTMGNVSSRLRDPCLGMSVRFLTVDPRFVQDMASNKPQM